MQHNPDYFQLLKLAQSPAGQQLLHLLQENGGSNLQQALTKAGAGDLGPIRQVLSALLDDPKAKKLINELEGQP